MWHFLGKMAIVATLHMVVGVALYYGSVKGAFGACDSDILVIHAPGAIAFGAYFLLAWCGPLSECPPLQRRICLAALIAFAGFLVSFTCIGVVAANTWGT
jgi:hypothetical protein